MTINKSQSQSLKQIEKYLSRPVFTQRQLYVTLSRVSRKNSLKVLINNGEHFNNYCSIKNIVYKKIFSNLQATITI